LIEKGADIHARSDYALCRDANNGHLSVVKFLFEKGANIRANNDGALRWASQNDQLSVVDFLIENGCLRTTMQKKKE
jgi:ankyrin repeat protein